MPSMMGGADATPIPTAQAPLPQYQPYEPKPFVPQAPPFRITSAGDETWTPTGAAIDAWQQQEMDRSAQYDKQFGIQYGIQQDVQERQRLAEQEAYNRRAAGQEATAQAQEAAYKQAYDRWNAAGVVVSDADAQILGVPKGTKTSDHSYRLASTAISQMKALRGGSSPKPTQTEKTNTAKADAMQAVDEASAMGIPLDQVVQNINASYAELVRQGVKPEDIIQYAVSRGEAEPEKRSWYTNVDEKLGGWLPFGARR